MRLIYVYVFVCMYVCMHACMHVCMDISVHPYIHPFIDTNTCHIQWYRFKKDEAVLKAFDQYLDAPEPGKP